MRKSMVALLAAGIVISGMASTGAAGDYSSAGFAAAWTARTVVPVSAAWEAGVDNRQVGEIAHRSSPRRYKSSDRYSRRHGFDAYGGRSGGPYYRDRYGRRYYGYPGDYRDDGRYSRKYRSQPRFRIWIPGFWTSHGYMKGYWTFHWSDRRGHKHEIYDYECRYRC